MNRVEVGSDFCHLAFGMCCVARVWMRRLVFVFARFARWILALRKGFRHLITDRRGKTVQLGKPGQTDTSKGKLKMRKDRRGLNPASKPSGDGCVECRLTERLVASSPSVCRVWAHRML